MRRLLPYAFARTHQLLLEDDGHNTVLWFGDQPDLNAWSEVLRKFEVTQFEALDSVALAKRII